MKPRLKNFKGELEHIRKYIEDEIRYLRSLEFLSARSRDHLRGLIQIFERILTIELDNSNDWFELGLFLAELEEDALGGRAFKVVTLIDPNKSSGWIGLALTQVSIFNKQDEKEKILTGPLIKAEKYLEKAHSLSSKPSEWHAYAWYQLGAAWHLNGNESRTRRCMKRFTELNPE